MTASNILLRVTNLTLPRSAQPCDEGIEFFCAQSYSKNLGLYAERVGAINAVLNDAESAKTTLSQLNRIARAMVGLYTSRIESSGTPCTSGTHEQVGPMYKWDPCTRGTHSFTLKRLVSALETLKSSKFALRSPACIALRHVQQPPRARRAHRRHRDRRRGGGLYGLNSVDP
jgi:hypothetical protein